MKHVNNLKLSLSALALMALSGCGSIAYKDMTPEQIRATEGTISCTQATSLYGKASTIATKAESIKKGATSKGKTVINCGDASMTIESEDGASPVPATSVPVAPATK